MNNILAVLVSYNSLNDEDKKLFKQVIKVRDEDNLDELKKLLHKSSEVDTLDIFKKQSSVSSQPYIQPFSMDRSKINPSMICRLGGDSID